MLQAFISGNILDDQNRQKYFTLIQKTSFVVMIIFVALLGAVLGAPTSQQIGSAGFGIYFLVVATDHRHVQRL